jgi:hypothetical protein
MAKEFTPEPPKEVFVEFEKNETTKSRVALQTYSGKDYVDIRDTWLNNKTNEWQLGKGFTINTEDPDLTVEYIDKVIEGLQKAKAKIQSGEF